MLKTPEYTPSSLPAHVQARMAINAQHVQSEQLAIDPDAHQKHRLKSANAQMQFAEIQRIIGMPVYGPMTVEEQEAFNRSNILGKAFESGWRLFPIQCDAVWAFQTFGGLLGPIGVGWGKTLVAQMIANHALTVGGHKKAILMLPPNVLGQLIRHDMEWIRSRVPINFRMHVVGGRAARQRRAICHSNQPGLYVFPYSIASTRDAEDNLKAISPTCIILDEAHSVSKRRAARTQRLMRYIEEERKGDVSLAAISGTITRKTVDDYFHLLRIASRHNNPLPNSVHLAHEWGSVIDANGTSEGASTGPVQPLIDWAKRTFPTIGHTIDDDQAGFRKAYRLRLNTSPCVAASGDAEIGTSLTIANRPIPDIDFEDPSIEGLSALGHFMTQVQEEWLTPNGDEIDHAIHTWKWMFELSAGFYNQLVWPTAEEFAQRKGITIPVAEDILERARLHHAAGQAHAKAMRTWIDENGRHGLDSPFLIDGNIARNGDRDVGEDLYRTWKEKHDLDFEGRPDRDSHAIRVCPYKINAAVQWAMKVQSDKDHPGGIIWIYHNAIGKWLHEELVSAGLDCLHCPAGPAHNAAILDHGNERKIIVASIKAHGEGKNLQHFRNQYVMQWPRASSVAEQMLGRLHRNGQKADELVCVTNNTIEWDHMNMAACLVDSLYVHQTTGNRQKLVYCNYDPYPVIFPPAVLKERGFSNQLLSVEQQAIMDAKFNPTAS